MSTHPGSRRTTIIDVAGEALWLYLSEPGSTAPVNDCWLANLGPGRGSLTDEEKAALRQAGVPPPAPASVLEVTSNELPTDPGAYRLEWSQDGESVQAMLGERPIAFIAAGVKRGFHASLLVECPWGRPFDAQLHGRLFGLPQ